MSKYSEAFTEKLMETVADLERQVNKLEDQVHDLSLKLVAAGDAELRLLRRIEELRRFDVV